MVPPIGSPPRTLPAASALVLLGLLAALLAFAAPATLAAAGPSEVGTDVSYPQCATPPAPGAAFGLVGVNGGLANNANPCLAAQIAWARATPGRPARHLPSLSLYLNTADPGNTVADWPSPAAATAGPANAYGTCDGTWSTACAFEYGRQRAAASYALALTAGAPASSSPWWLDIETGESWAGPHSDASWKLLNVVTLRGFAAGLRDSGARATIGLYSNAREWRAITGLDARASRRSFAAGQPDWVTGANTLAQARAACGHSFSGGPVRLAQFPHGGRDGDLACPPARARLRRRR